MVRNCIGDPHSTKNRFLFLFPLLSAFNFVLLSFRILFYCLENYRSKIILRLLMKSFAALNLTLNKLFFTFNLNVCYTADTRCLVVIFDSLCLENQRRSVHRFWAQLPLFAQFAKAFCLLKAVREGILSFEGGVLSWRCQSKSFDLFHSIYLAGSIHLSCQF